MRFRWSPVASLRSAGVHACEGGRRPAAHALHLPCAESGRGEECGRMKVIFMEALPGRSLTVVFWTLLQRQVSWAQGVRAVLLGKCLAAGCGIAVVSAAAFAGGESKPSTAAQPLPASVDLRLEFDRWGLPRWRQGARSTCSAFTIAGALEFALAKREGQGTRLSVEFLNWAANRQCGDAQDGGFFSDLWKGFMAHGICAAEACPYAAAFDASASPTPEAIAEAKKRLGLGLRLGWIKEWDVTTGLKDEHLIRIKGTLASGWPVCAGLRWPKQEQWKDGVLQLCPADAVRDGHSVLVVGYRDDPGQPGGGVLIFRNTAKAGVDGMMPYAYARAYMNDAAWIE